MVSLILVGFSVVIAADGGSSTETDRSVYESARQEAGRDARRTSGWPCGARRTAWARSD